MDNCAAGYCALIRAYISAFQNLIILYLIKTNQIIFLLIPIFFIILLIITTMINLHRITNERFTVRFCHVANGLGIKTVGAMHKFLNKAKPDFKVG